MTEPKKKAPSKKVEESEVEPKIIATTLDGAPVEYLDAPEPTVDLLPPAQLGDGADLHRLVDRYDEGQLIQALQHKLSETFLYKIKKGNQEIVDLSHRGVTETIQEMNRLYGFRINIDPASMRDSIVDLNGKPHVRVTVYCKSETTGFGAFGTSTQPLRMKLRPETVTRKKAAGDHVYDDGTVDDDFAFEKALTKAQRNAFSKMIPERLRLIVIAQYFGDESRVQRIKAGAVDESLALMPAPLDTPEADAKRTEIREIYNQIHELNPLKMPPAKFNNWLTRAEWSMERLEDCRKAMSNVLGEAKAEAK